MVDKRNYDLNLFLTPSDMVELVKFGKAAKCIERLESTLSQKDLDKLMTDFATKISYEIRPALQIDNQWLEAIFGYKGELRINVDTQNVDAIFISDDHSQITELELKQFSVSPKLSERCGGETDFSPNGVTHYQVSTKSWKFRCSDLREDAALLMIINNRTDDLVDVICVNRVDMNEIIEQCKTDKFNGGNIPCKVSYRHVRNQPHMVGNKSVHNSSKLLVDWLVNERLIVKKANGFYDTATQKFVGRLKYQVMNWFLTEYSKRSTNTFGKIKERFLTETGLLDEAMRIVDA